MRQVEKERKNFSPEFRSNPTCARIFKKKLPKISKNFKKSFQHYFYPNRDEIRQEKEKNIVVPTFVPTRTRLENSKKKNSKKIQRNKKHHSGIISIKSGITQAKKERKKFQSQIPFPPDLGQKIQKKLPKFSKNFKKSFRHYFYLNWYEIGQEKEKKNLVPTFVPTRIGLENSK